MVSRDVARRTASASATLLAARTFAKFVDLALVVVLAWILVPADFAVVAIAMVFIQFTGAVTEIPVSQVLIRAPEVTDLLLDTAFTIAALRAIFLTLLLGALAPIAMMLYDDERLGLLIVFLALAPALRGLMNPRLALYARQLNYIPEATIEALAKALTACIAVPLALWTRSYWSLAIMTVLTPVAAITASYIFAPYRPRLTLKEWPFFANMVSWSTVAQLFVAANWQADIFVFGLFAKKDQVGHYSMSQTLAGAPFQALVVPVIRPFFATFAELRTPQAIRPAFLAASGAVFTAVAPLLALIVLLSGPIVEFAFNDSWRGASLFLSVLAFTQIIILPMHPIPMLALSLDKTRFYAVQAATGLLVKIPLMLIGWHVAGVDGFLAGQVLGMLAWSVAGSFIVRHLIGVRIRDQALALMRPITALAGLAIVVLLLRPFVSFESSIMTLLTSAAVGALGMLAYIAAVFSLWKLSKEPEGIEQMIFDLLTRFILRRSEHTSPPEASARKPD